MAKTTLKSRLLSVLMLIAIISSFISVPTHAAGTSPQVGGTINGFEVTDKSEFELLNSTIYTFEHKKTGADVIYCKNKDTNRAFNIAFRTPVYNDKGTTHIFEHSTMSGSENYPSSTLALKLMSQTYNTYMNASTGQNVTTYPIGSLSEEQLYALSDYYLDCVFNPLIYTDSSIFDREAWHYELENADDELTISGTVYSEMRGSDTINSASYSNLFKTIYPDSCVSYTSGGNPDKIPELTNGELVDYHKKYYTPSNSLTMLYGDLDYAAFLTLLDKYFSEYEKTELDIDFEAYTPTENTLEASFEYPVVSGSKTDKQSVILYAIECKDLENSDLIRLDFASSIISSELQDRADTKLPGSIVSCEVNSSGPETLLVFSAQNVNPEDKYTFKDIVEKSILAASQFKYKESEESVKENIKRNKLLAFEYSNIGTELSQSVMSAWARTGDPILYFENSNALGDYNELCKDNAFSYAIKTYLLNPGRTAMVITTPKAGLKEKQQAEYKSELAAKKAAMSMDEISEIIAKTKAYKENAIKNNDETDKPLIDKLSVVDPQTLPENLKEYKISEKQTNGAVFITAESDIDDILQGRIMLDVSDMTINELDWLALYSLVIGNLNTEDYLSDSVSGLMGNADGEVYITTLPADNVNGFIPYLTFQYRAYADESELVFNFAKEIFFKTSFNDTKKINSIVSKYANAYENSVANYGYDYMLMDGFASGDTEQAYYEKLSGLSHHNFIKEVLSLLESNPEEVTKQLENIQKKITNRSGIIMLYAGNEKSIKAHTMYAQPFPLTLEFEKKELVDYTSLKTEYKDKALLMDSDVNHNGVYAPFDNLGIDYSVKSEVAINYVTDKFLIPEIRNKNNSYDIDNTVDSTGLALVSYRDPEIETTFNTYANLSNMLRYSTITQDDVNNYILPIYSAYTLPIGELNSAYEAAVDYSSGITYADNLQTLKDLKNTTVEDVKAYADVFEKLWDEGILFTAGNIADIAENKYLYDEIINPMDYNMPAVEENNNKITVLLNKLKLKSDVPAQIIDGRTLVPLRAIFESLNMNVEWDDATQTVTATGNGAAITMTIGENSFTKNEQTITLDVPAQVVNGRTLVPVRAISESLDYTVTWIEETQTVEITR